MAINVKKFLAKIKIDHTVQLLTYSDILFLSAQGLVSPIFAVFITEQIDGGSIETVGIATALCLITRSLFQIPISKIVDKKKGEHDDFYLMLIGGFLVTITSALYIWATTPLHVYILQIFLGISGALTFPTWAAIFTRHISKDSPGWEWAFYQTSTDVATALTAGLGGYLASKFGFKSLFAIVAIASLIGNIFLIGIRDDLKKR